MSTELPTSQDLGPLQAFGARVGHDAGVYGLASGGALVLGVVSLAIYTRFLPPSEFGALAAVLVFSALLTVVYGLGWVQGTSRALFKGADEDGIPDDREEHVELAGPLGSRAQVLVTALVATTVTAGLGTIAVGACAPELADLLVGNANRADAIRWAGGLGAIGAIWRLAANVVRLEGRPWMWAAVNLARPILGLAVSIPLLTTGSAEITDVLIGFVVGNTASVILTIAVLHLGRPSWPRPTGFSALFRLGARLIPVAIAMWTLQNADVIVFSQVASNADLGLYRAASRIGAVAAYATSAFFLAFGPVRRQETHAVALREHGQERTSIVILTSFVVLATALFLLLALGADLFVRVAAPEYADAAPLIPLTAAGALAIGYFRLTYSLATFRQKRVAFTVLCLIAAAAFVPIAVAAISAWEGYGAAIAVAVAPLIGVIGMAMAARLAGQRLLPDARPLAAVVLLGTVCLVVGLGLGRLAGPAGPLVEFAALASFPPLLVLTGLVPREELAGLWLMIRTAARPARGQRQSE